ncbi:MAG: PAS domain S-box protein, partial [bacterium]
MKRKSQGVKKRDTFQLQAARRVIRDYNAEALLKLQRNLANELTAPGSFMETLDRILVAGCRIAGIDCGGIYLVDAARRELELVCHRGLSPAFRSSESRYTAKSPQTPLVLAGRALYFNATRIKAGNMRAVRREGIRSLAVVPVRHGDKVVAVLNLASRTVDEIDQHLRNVIETIAAQIGPTVARVQAESAVLASERNFQSLFSSMEEFLFISDAAGKLVHMNPVAERRLGYSSAEVRGKHLTVLHPRLQRRAAIVTVTAMLAGKTDTCEIPLQARNGDLIDVETRVVRGEWNGKLAMFGISRDVTERRRVERELMERQGQLHSLVSQLGVAEETERRRIAHGVHDDIGQLLAICKMQLDGLMIQVKGAAWRDQVDEIRQLIIRLLQVSRSLTFDLASPVLQRFGLKSAVEDLCEKMTERHGVLFSIRATPSTI